MGLGREVSEEDWVLPYEENVNIIEIRINGLILSIGLVLV
jgi:hypothetical protein